MEMNVPSQSPPSASASTSTAASTASTAAKSAPLTHQALPPHAAASLATARHAPTPTPTAAPPVSRSAPAPAVAVAAKPSTTPQQVAAAAAAIAASRAATVSAAMRSVFGANAAHAAKQAALASAMMTAAAANISKHPAASTPTMAKPLASTPTAIATPTTPARTAIAATLTPTTITAGSSVVVMQRSFDGLPVLPSQAAACCEDDCARLHALTCEYDVPRDGAVSLYGEPTTRHAVRKSLVQLYAANNQLSVNNGECMKTSSTSASLTEMTLRVDTEMELLRRQCFAERNARWQFHTPDMYTFAMDTEPVWTTTPYIGPRKKTQLLRKRQELLRVHNGSSDKATTAEAAAMLESETLLQSLLGVELVRDRTWPPKEFVSKSNSKPSRGGSVANNANRTSSGKKKPVGMAGIVDETPTQARVCVECHTQSSALWRKRPRAQPQPLAVTTMGLATAEGLVVAVLPPVVVVEEDDVCLPCFLKTQRRDIFERKTAEKIRKAKEDALRAAAEARALKKQQQQMQKKLKKQAASQQSQPQTPEPELVDSRVKAEKYEEPTSMSSTTLTFVLKEERGSNGSSSRLQLKPQRRESLGGGGGGGGNVSSGAEGWSSAVDEKKKKSEKKSKKDKKKKKKKKKKKTAASDWDDSESDDDGASSSVILPSPPQRTMDGFVYADRSETTTTASMDHFKLEDPVSGMSSETVSIDMEVETTTTKPKRSSSKRQSSSSSRSATASSSSSKKRKSSEVFAETAIAPIAVAVAPPPPTPSASSSRSSRAKAASAAAAAPPTVASPAAAAATPSARKRARPTKKESARERELRALGQYCPVCNMTYEEDDASPFVCCDSCEMWVHAGCDASLSSEALAALADSNEKYICPLCSGR